MTTTAVPAPLNPMTDLTTVRDRSTSNNSLKQQQQQPQQQDSRSSAASEPRTLSMDYSSSAAGNGGINGRHDPYYDQQQQQQQQQQDPQQQGYTTNGYNNSGHPSAASAPSSSSSSSTLVPSHYSSHPQGNSASGYLPPPIQTTPLSSNANSHNGGSNGHHLGSNNGSSSSLADVYHHGGHQHDSFVSPTSPLSPVNGQHYHAQQQQQQQYYDYDQGHPSSQQYSSHAYHAYHASYPQEHHQHPLSPTVEGGPHFQYMQQGGGNGSTMGASAMGSNGLYSTSASSSSSSARHNSYPSNSSNHHSSASSGTMYNSGFDDLQDSPGGPGSHPAGSMPLASPVGSYVGHRDSFPGLNYSTSAPSPSTIVRPKRRSDVYASHESPYFYPAQQHYNLYSMDRSSSYNVKITAKIDRGFFLAANDWTCYRRNYFQLSASFSIIGLDTSIHSEVPCLLERGGELISVSQFLICIGARIQNGEKVIELVQHTPKRDKGPQMTPRPSPVRAGGDLNHNPEEANPTVVTFERVQFKTATANNGKRRAAQQYYQVHVDLYAETDRGELIMVATSNSAPLVVRGRSPGHYADNDEAMMMQSSTSAMGGGGQGGADFDRGYYDRNNSVSSSNGDYSYYPSYPYGSYPYQSLGSASHLAQQQQQGGAPHDSSYYDRVGPNGQGHESYPTSPLSPVSPQGGHPGDLHSQNGSSAYPNYITPPQVSHGSSPEAVSPDMYSPAGFVSGPTTDQSPPSSSASSMHRVAPFHTHSYQSSSSAPQQYPGALGHDQLQQQQHQQQQQAAGASDGYEYAGSQYGGSEQDFEADQSHEAQMAGLRIHSPVNSPPGTPMAPRRQSFSVANKKGDRLSSMAGPQGVRKPRSVTVSAGVAVPTGISKRSSSKTRVMASTMIGHNKAGMLPMAVKEELGKSSNGNSFASLGSKERSIPESPMEEHQLI